LKWIATSEAEVRSECGKYRVRSGHIDGNFYVATCLPTGAIVVASSDKDFVKLRCELHAKYLATLGQPGGAMKPITGGKFLTPKQSVRYALERQAKLKHIAEQLHTTELRTQSRLCPLDWYRGMNGEAR
jgi:hypothetical protein